MVRKNPAGQGGQLRYDASQCAAGKVVLHELSQLEYGTCGVSSYDTDVADEDPNKGEDGWYRVPMVSLVADCENYAPDYLLVWLPDEQLFGTYDVEHRHLRVFPGAAWSDLRSDPVKYINSQWDRSAAFAEDAKPWLFPKRWHD